MDAEYYFIFSAIFWDDDPIGYNYKHEIDFTSLEKRKLILSFDTWEN